MSLRSLGTRAMSLHTGYDRVPTTDIHACVYFVYDSAGREHRCGKRAVAVHFDTERRPLCATHERIYLRARQ